MFFKVQNLKFSPKSFCGNDLEITFKHFRKKFPRFSNGHYLNIFLKFHYFKFKKEENSKIKRELIELKNSESKSNVEFNRIMYRLKFCFEESVFRFCLIIFFFFLFK